MVQGLNLEVHHHSDFPSPIGSPGKIPSSDQRFAFPSRPPTSKSALRPLLIHHTPTNTISLPSTKPATTNNGISTLPPPRSPPHTPPPPPPTPHTDNLHPPTALPSSLRPRERNIPHIITILLQPSDDDQRIITIVGDILTISTAPAPARPRREEGHLRSVTCGAQATMWVPGPDEESDGEEDITPAEDEGAVGSQPLECVLFSERFDLVKDV